MQITKIDSVNGGKSEWLDTTEETENIVQGLPTKTY